MSSTHLSLHYHVGFGTKNHEPMIQSAWRKDLRAYLGGIIRTAKGIAESVGGVSDQCTCCLAPAQRPASLMCFAN
jgi:putative transposase